MANMVVPKNRPGRIRSTRIVNVPVRVKPVVEAQNVTVRKRTFTRTDLPNGDFMMNYYFKRDVRGRLVPEDIDSATHFERVVYDRNGNTIGSTVGELDEKIRW